jgi:hypothetical protein
MADGGITRDEMEKLLSEHARQVGSQVRASGGGSGSGKVDVGGMGGAIGAAADKASAGLTAVMTPLSSAFTDIKSSVDKGLGTWRDMNSVGANFNNDIIGMTVAAYGSRLSLDEMAAVVKQNSTNFVGLGGSVGSGTQAFAKMSKEMADSGATESLKQMGYTNKEINDVLALQIGFQRTTTKQTEEGRRESYESAKKLATEMDAMSKLTGKSRAEQEDAMKKAQADGQVEAKMRLIGLKEGPEAEAKARKIYAEQYNEAQLRGQGQMFKEVFATGHVMSQEAANQQAILGEQARATADQARATAAGDYEAAKSANERAQAEAVKNGQDVNRLQMAAIGGQNNVVGAEMIKQIELNRGMNDAVMAIKKEAAFKDKDETVILAEAKRRIAFEQQGKDAKGNEIAGAQSTKAMIALGNRAGDAGSAIMSGLVKPINDAAGPALKSIANVLGPEAKTKSGAPTTKVKIMEQGFAKGVQGGPAAARPANEPAAMAGVPVGPRSSGGALGEAAQAIGAITGTIAKATFTGIEHLNIDGIKKYAEGGIVDKPELAIVGDAGREHIIPDAKLQAMIQNIKASAVQASASTSTPETPVMPSPTDMMQKMDLSSMTKGIKFEGIEASFTKMFDQLTTLSKPEDGKAEAPAATAQQVSLKDVLDSLERLNKTMGSMASHTESISELSGKQIRATKSLSNNRFA